MYQIKIYKISCKLYLILAHIIFITFYVECYKFYLHKTIKVVLLKKILIDLSFIFSSFDKVKSIVLLFL